MKIPIGTPVLIYNYQYKKYLNKAEIILVSKEYYWLGNGNVGYMEWNGNMWDWHISLNVFEISHITHIVPYGMKNPNYGGWIKNCHGFGVKIDTDFFINNMQWKDFEKENIE